MKSGAARYDRESVPGGCPALTAADAADAADAGHGSVHTAANLNVRMVALLDLYCRAITSSLSGAQ